MNRDDVEVRARSGYYVLPTLFHRGGAAAASPKAGGNLAGTIPNPELQMRLSATPVGPVNGKTSVVFSVGLELPAPGVATSETVDVEIAAFDDYGRVQGSTTALLALKVPPTMAQPVPYHLLGRIDLKPGRYNVRAFVRAKERDKRGTLFADLIVPDMSRPALSMSGLVLQPTPAPIAEPKSVLAKLIPVIPATARDFTRGDEVDVWFRVVQGGDKAVRPVEVRMKVQDQHGTAVVERTMTLEEMVFHPGRSSDSRFQLAFSNLQPGPHLLTIEVSAGNATAAQAAKFTIR